MNRAWFIILFSLTIPLSLGQEILGFISNTTYYPVGPVTILWYINDISPTSIAQDFTSSANESLFFDMYDAPALNSALSTNNCGPFPTGYTLISMGTYNIDYPLSGYTAGFYVDFNDLNSITDGSIHFELDLNTTETYGLLLCNRLLSNDYIFLEGYFANVFENSFVVNSFNYNGIYSIVSYDSTIRPTKNILFGQSFIISQILAVYLFPNGFSITVVTNTSITLTVQFNTTNPTPNPSCKISQGQFVDITTSDTIDELNATLTFTYTQYNPNFAIGHFDEISNGWSFPIMGLSINTTAATVSQTTNHFSTWGLYGETASANIISPTFLFLIALIIVFII